MPGHWPGIFLQPLILNLVRCGRCCWGRGRWLGCCGWRERRLIASGRGCDPRNDGSGLDLASGRFRQIDAVVLQGRRQGLVEPSARVGIGSLGRDQVVFIDGKGALLQQHIGRC